MERFALSKFPVFRPQTATFRHKWATPRRNYQSIVRTDLGAIRLMQLEQAVERLSSRPPQPLSVKDFIDSRNHPWEASKFLTQDCPVRVAHVIKLLTSNSIPEVMRPMNELRQVIIWYFETLDDLLKAQAKLPDAKAPASVKDAYVEELVETSKKIMNRHKNVVMSIARAIRDAKQTWEDNGGSRNNGNGPNPVANLGPYLDRFYLARVGIRLIFHQFVAVFGQKDGEKHGDSSVHHPEYGVFNQGVDLNEACLFAAERAGGIFRQTYNCAPPKVSIEFPQTRIRRVDDGNGKRINSPLHLPITFPYIPSHIDHILFELLKNSMRAVMEHHGDEDNPSSIQTEDATIKIFVVMGREDVTFRVHDKGGGIPRSALSKLWSYTYTTARNNGVDIYDGDTRSAPLAGFGYGLPMSRIYARYFGGDLQIVSTEGFGTDAYVFLRSLASDAREVLVDHRQESEFPLYPMGATIS